MMKSFIDHIAIKVSDLKVAEKWYCEHLDAQITFRDEKYTRIRVKNTNMADMPLEKGEVVKHRDGTIGVYVKDPFGNYLEYIWYSEEQKKVFLINE